MLLGVNLLVLALADMDPGSVFLQECGLRELLSAGILLRIVILASEKPHGSALGLRQGSNRDINLTTQRKNAKVLK